MGDQPRHPPYLVLMVLLSSAVKGVKSPCNLQPEQFLTGQHGRLIYTVSNNIGVHNCPIMLQKQAINQTKPDADYVGDCQVTNNGNYVCTPTKGYRITGGQNEIVLNFENISAVNEGRYQFHSINCKLTHTDECHVKLKSNLEGGFDSDVTPMPESVRTTSNETTDETKQDASNGTPTGLVVGILTVIAIVVILVIGFVVWRRLGRNWKCQKRCAEGKLEEVRRHKRHKKYGASKTQGEEFTDEEEKGSRNMNLGVDTTPLKSAQELTHKYGASKTQGEEFTDEEEKGSRNMNPGVDTTPLKSVQELTHKYGASKTQGEEFTDEEEKGLRNMNPGVDTTPLKSVQELTHKYGASKTQGEEFTDEEEKGSRNMNYGVDTTPLKSVQELTHKYGASKTQGEEFTDEEEKGLRNMNPGVDTTPLKSVQELTHKYGASKMQGEELTDEEEKGSLNMNLVVDTTHQISGQKLTHEYEKFTKLSPVTKQKQRKQTRPEAKNASSKPSNSPVEFKFQSEQGGNYSTQKHETPSKENTLTFDLEKTYVTGDEAAECLENNSASPTQTGTGHSPLELLSIPFENNTQVEDTCSTHSSLAESNELESHQDDVESEPEEDINGPKHHLLQQTE